MFPLQNLRFRRSCIQPLCHPLHNRHVLPMKNNKNLYIIFMAVGKNWQAKGMNLWRYACSKLEINTMDLVRKLTENCNYGSKLHGVNEQSKVQFNFKMLVIATKSWYLDSNYSKDCSITWYKKVVKICDNVVVTWHLSRMRCKCSTNEIIDQNGQLSHHCNVSTWRLRKFAMR